MKEQFGISIFEHEADHHVEMVRQHASLSQIQSTGCPVCGTRIRVSFEPDGSGFSLACTGKPEHCMIFQDIEVPPSWWRECVLERTDITWYWRISHVFDAKGNLSMPVSGWTADNVRWSGGFACAVNHPDYSFWRWIIFESGCELDLISDSVLAELRINYQSSLKQGYLKQG